MRTALLAGQATPLAGAGQQDQLRGVAGQGGELLEGGVEGAGVAPVEEGRVAVDLILEGRLTAGARGSNSPG